MSAAVGLHHRIDGPKDAPVLVLGHSIGCDKSMWDPQVQALSERFSLLRYDHRGHGGSPVPPGPYSLDDLGADVLALLDRLELERVHLGGLSLGGMVAMWIAARAPERVERLVLCCTSAYMAPAETWHERARIVRAEGMGALTPSPIERWLTPAFRAREPATAARLERTLLATAPEGYAGCCEAIAGMDLRRRAARHRGAHAGGRRRRRSRHAAGARRGHRRGDPRRPARGAARRRPPGQRRAARIADPRRGRASRRPGSEGSPMTDPLHERGMEVRREVLGDAHVDAAVARTSDFTAEFQDFITRYAWGEIWTRPGLDRRTRSCITLTALVAHGHLEELKLHVRAALRNGLEPDEIKEVLLQTAIYCGVPAANAAFAVAQRVLEEEGR